MKCVIFGSVGPQTARFDLSGVPVRGTLFLFAALVRICSAWPRHPASWCRYLAYPGGRWPTSGRQARHRLPDPSLARVRKTGSHWLPVLFMTLSLCAGSVQRNPGILPVGADTRLIRAGAGRHSGPLSTFRTGSVQRNPGILPVGVDTRLIRAGAGRRQGGKPAIDYPIRALPEYVNGEPLAPRFVYGDAAQFSAIQASCQLVPIPGSYWVALADHWLHQPR